MSDHYDWRCASCGTHGGIRDDSYVLRLSTNVYHPYGGKSGSDLVTVCPSCDRILRNGNYITLWGDINQTISRDNIIRRV